MVLIGTYFAGYLHGFGDSNASLVDAATTSTALKLLRDGNQSLALELLEGQIDGHIVIYATSQNRLSPGNFLFADANKSFMRTIARYRLLVPSHVPDPGARQFIEQTVEREAAEHGS
jgi:hypothetical protein